MKKKILLFALLFNFISHAQDAVFLSHLDVDNSGLFYFKNKLYSGNVVELFSNGQKKKKKAYERSIIGQLGIAR